MASNRATKETPAEQPTDEVAVSDRFKREDLRQINSLQDALALAVETYGQPVANAATELGDGFAVLPTEKKHLLIGLPCVFLEWNFNNGDSGPFVSARVVAQREDGSVFRCILNDGSTGIYKVLREYTDAEGRDGGLFVPNGLRVSEYMYEDEHGQRKPAKTYYIDTSA